MPRISLAFFTAAAIYGLIGMVWGSYMGATQNHLQLPSHAHLNLLGWVGMSIMGGFYALAGDKAPLRLAKANFVLSNLGLIVMIPMLVCLLAGNDKLGPFMPIGEGLTFLGLVCFLLAVISVWRATPATA